VLGAWLGWCLAWLVLGLVGLNDVLSLHKTFERRSNPVVAIIRMQHIIVVVMRRECIIKANILSG